ncbi:MAG: MBL fold metallo-hydrolase [Asticcacaulis sp.]
MSQSLSVTILGSGCSTGVPRSDGYWGACDPENPRNHRSRCSAWFALRDEDSGGMTSVLIDTSPDFRLQSARAGIPHLDAILWTHDHADQTGGMDDIRAFTFGHGPIPGYSDQATFATLSGRFAYAFTGNQGYPPISAHRLIPPHGALWTIVGEGGALPVVTFDQIHGPIHSVGYRIGDIAYSSDVSALPEESFDALHGLKLWIVDALRYKPHPTHSHLEQTLEWIARVKPQRAIITNLHQDMDYDVLAAMLPENVEPAFDQMRMSYIISMS